MKNWVRFSKSSLIFALLAGALLVFEIPLENAEARTCEDVFSSSVSNYRVEPGQALWVSRNGRHLYARVDGNPHAKHTLLLINGLDRGLGSWEPFMSELQKSHRIIRMDLWGQGETLGRNGLRGGYAGFQIDEIVRDIDAVVNEVGVQGKLQVIGHSFGGGVAVSMLKKSRLQMDQVFLLAPYVPRLEEEQPFVGDAFRMSRQLMGPIHDMMMYFSTTTGMHMGHSIQSMAFKSAIETQAVANLTNAIRMEDEVLYRNLNASQVPVHLITSDADFLIPRGAHQKMWAQVASAAKGVWLRLRLGSHYIPERKREAYAASHVVNLILQGDERLPADTEIEVDILSRHLHLPDGTLDF